MYIASARMVAAMLLSCGFAVSAVGLAGEQLTAPVQCLNHRSVYGFAEPTAIPDNDPAGVTIGPLRVPCSPPALEEVVLAVDIAHPYAGELTMALHYDSDNDGDYDASSGIEIHLARPLSCAAEELWACPIELSGRYFFRDEGWDAAGEATSLRRFEQLPSGGSFYLSVTDDGPGQTGRVLGWSVYVEGAIHATGGPRSDEVNGL